MTFAEIIYRLDHHFKKSRDKKFSTNQDKFLSEVPADIDLSFCHLLTNHLSPEELRVIDLNAQIGICSLADAYINNKYNLFGIPYQYEERIDWHLDPKTSKSWPLHFWGDINIRDGHTIGGPKFVWESNRLYCLPILGMAYRMTGDKKYAEKLLKLLGDWMEANPYPLGINWTSGIEIGVRLANLMWGLSFLNGYDQDKSQGYRVNRFVLLHAQHLFRYPSKFSSNNNHAIAEAFGIFLAGVCFPHLQEARKWTLSGKKILEREVCRQILPDGGSYEFTTTYLSFVFDFFLLFRLINERLGLSYDGVIDERLERSCEHIHALMDCNGNIPNIGDQDSAILVNLGQSNHENFQSILNTGAVLFNRPEFCCTNFADFKTRILIGDRLPTTLPAIQAKKNKQGSMLQDSGLTVIDTVCNGRQVLFTGNATPLGMPPLYAHGHLDALSFTLSVSGQEVFIDPGTYLYHSGGKWRRYFRSTAAHNTIRINNADLTKQTGDFMFGKPYTITEHSLEEFSPDDYIWRASHNAYEKLHPPVSVSREVLFQCNKSRFILTDTVNSSGQYAAEQFFHLHPDCQVTINNNEAVLFLNDSPCISIKFGTKSELTVYNGSDDPLLGWYSPSFNIIHKTNTLVARSLNSGENRFQVEISILNEHNNPKLDRNIHEN